MTIFIHKGNSQVSFYIGEMGFNGYTIRDAKRIYRERHGLRYKRIEWIDLR